MLKGLGVTGSLLFFVLGPIAGLKALQLFSLSAYADTRKAAGRPPVSVASAVVAKQRWEESFRSVGTLRAVRGTMLSAEVSGTVVAIAVENGARVEKGALLVRLDASVEEAQLAAAEARLKLAELQLDRSRRLLERRTISQSEFDSAEASAKAASAEADNDRALIAKKTIRAPHAGRVGIRSVNLGQTLSAGTAIIPIQALDPIFVDFTLPQQRIGELEEGQRLRVGLDGSSEVFSGRVTAIAPQVDSSTRNVSLQGTLDNPLEKLRPGMFAEVSLVLPERRDVIAVPATAVVHAPYGDSVYLVEQKEGRTFARQRFVRVGESRGDFVEIREGLAAGDRVVSAGAFKLRNEAAIVLDDAMQPQVSLEPKPRNS